MANFTRASGLDGRVMVWVCSLGTARILPWTDAGQRSPRIRAAFLAYERLRTCAHQMVKNWCPLRKNCSSNVSPTWVCRRRAASRLAKYVGADDPEGSAPSLDRRRSLGVAPSCPGVWFSPESRYGSIDSDRHPMLPTRGRRRESPGSQIARHGEPCAGRIARRVEVWRSAFASHQPVGWQA